jgi:NodT family efflux transporter outer membrane factor (OMF) lipoprotein
LNIVQGQFNLGSASKADILLQKTQLASSYSTLPPLKQGLSQQYHALSILIGELPREDHFPLFKLEALHLPADLPTSCPSLLTRQRPDIRAAEALLHAASAQIGVATANMFPQITLNAMYGAQGNVLHSLFTSPNVVWNIASNASQTLFQGGMLIAKRRAAIAAYDQAAAQYKQTVLQAFQNVADRLRALQNDADLLKAKKEVETTALETLHLTQQEFQLGGSSFLDLLIAQRAYQLALIDRIQAQALRFSDTAALFEALGGGWWNQPALAFTTVSYIEPCVLCRVSKE